MLYFHVLSHLHFDHSENMLQNVSSELVETMVTRLTQPTVFPPNHSDSETCPKKLLNDMKEYYLNTQTIKNHQNPQCELTPLVSVALLPHRLGRCGWRPEDR